MLSRVTLLSLIWLAVGCESLSTIAPEGQHVQQAQQMPESVAKKVVASYLGNAWVENPYVYNWPACGSHVIPLPFAQMDTFEFGFWTENQFKFGNSKGKLFSCNEGGMIIATGVKTQEQAQELVAALKALGARL